MKDEYDVTLTDGADVRAADGTQGDVLRLTKVMRGRYNERSA